MRQTIPSVLASAALNEQDFLFRVFGNCVAGSPLDREIDDRVGKAVAVQRVKADHFNLDVFKP
jgi:hypothetical protein